MGRLAQWVMGGTHSDVTVGQDTAGKPPASPAGDERVWDRDGLRRGRGGRPARQLRGVSGHLLCQRRGEQTTREPSAKPRLVTPDVQ